MLGCDLLANPDSVVFVATVGGAAQSNLAIPAYASLVGLTIYHQHLVLETQPPGQLTGITSTNALALTIGSF